MSSQREGSILTGSCGNGGGLELARRRYSAADARLLDTVCMGPAGGGKFARISREADWRPFDVAIKGGRQERPRILIPIGCAMQQIGLVTRRIKIGTPDAPGIGCPEPIKRHGVRQGRGGTGRRTLTAHRGEERKR